MPIRLPPKSQSPIKALPPDDSGTPTLPRTSEQTRQQPTICATSPPLTQVFLRSSCHFSDGRGARRIRPIVARGRGRHPDRHGKNRAIHAYDGMVWKIRTGFLTLLFGGWAILLKGLVKSPNGPSYHKPLALGLFLFSAGFAFAAWSVDRAYIRRKFRVIDALGRLIDAIRTCGGDYLQIPPELLKVAGDCAQMPFDSAGCREATRAELSVYLIPLAILVAAIVLVIY
jgi:hypothetical protein